MKNIRHPFSLITKLNYYHYIVSCQYFLIFLLKTVFNWTIDTPDEQENRKKKNNFSKRQRKNHLILKQFVYHHGGFPDSLSKLFCVPVGASISQSN